jgi:SNF2 family DNA or RNA helicase
MNIGFNSFHSIMHDKMGLGKTLEIIALIAHTKGTLPDPLKEIKFAKYGSLKVPYYEKKSDEDDLDSDQPKTSIRFVF